MENGSFVKGLEAGIPEGTRPVGRPRMRWSDNIKKDIEMLGLENPAEWRDEAQNRRQWRLLVEASRDQMGPLAVE